MALLKKLHPSESALLVVDIQEKLMPAIHDNAKVLKNSALLIKAAKALHLPVLATTQYAEKIGALLPDVRRELGDVLPVDKIEFDCMGNPGFRKKLDCLPAHIDNLILCGVETHICIYQTAVGAMLAGYRLWIAADAVSSRTPANHETGINRLRELGGEIGSAELIIYELLQKAGTPEFKALLPFIK